MANPEKIDSLIRNLRLYTGYLRQLADLSEGDFLDDPIKTGAAKY